MNEKEQRLMTLAQDYINTINLMAYTDITPEDRRTLSADRTILHDELIALTGKARPFDMKTYCANLLSGRARVILA